MDVSFLVSDLPGIMNTPEFKLRFTASDTGDVSVVEAGNDALFVTVTECDELYCPGDINGDLTVYIADLLEVIAYWGNPCMVEDLLLVIAQWGSCN